MAFDPSAPHASGIRRALPHARIVLDHFHLVMLANSVVTEVRQRAQREQHARRGGRFDPAWGHRQMLLRARETLSPRALARLDRVLATDDPTGEPGAAWAVKERLRAGTARPTTAGTPPRTAGPGSSPPGCTVGA